MQKVYLCQDNYSAMKICRVFSMKILIYSLVISFFGLVFFTLAKAQSKYFYNYYTFNGAENLEMRAIIEVKPNEFLLSGTAGINAYDQYNLFLFSIDNKGSVLHDSWSMVDSVNTYILDLMKLADGGYAATGIITPDTPDHYAAFFCQMDSNHQIIQAKTVGNTQYRNYTTSLCRTPDGGFILAGNIRSPDTTQVYYVPYLIRLDAEANVLWDTAYYDCCTEHLSNINDIQPAPDGGYYLSGYRNGFYTLEGEGLLLKIDENANVVSSRFIDYEGYRESGGNLLQLADGELLLTGIATYNVQPPPKLWGLVHKLNADLSDEWHREDLFEGYSPNAVTLTQDSNIFISGGRAGNNLDIELCKLTPSGKLLWQRVYGTSLSDYAWAMLPTSDGGFMIGGHRSMLNSVGVTVLKTNCMGLLTEPQAAFTAYQTGDSPLEVGFQNLSQYVYPDSIDGGYYVWDFGDGSPPFVCGQGYGACPALVTHNYAMQGQYAATLTAFVCTDTATVTQQFSVVPTAVGQVAVPTYHISVLPNPASDVLHLEAVGALSSSHELQFSLYDAMGRAVRRLALRANGGSVRLDVADLPQGLYFWTCYSPDAVLQSGRVVIGNE